MPEERNFYHDLDDAAADFWTITDPATDRHAPGFDEWNVLRPFSKLSFSRP